MYLEKNFKMRLEKERRGKLQERIGIQDFVMEHWKKENSKKDFVNALCL